MTATETDLFRFLDQLGVSTATSRHPPVFTVEESKALRGALPGAHSKNLFLKDRKGSLWLVVVDEDRVVDLKDLRRRLGAATLSFARPEVMWEALGIEPGSVTPFAVLNDTAGRVQVVIDRALLHHDRLNFHPLTNTATTAISPQGLLAFLAACGHRPEVLPF